MKSCRGFTLCVVCFLCLWFVLTAREAFGTFTDLFNHSLEVGCQVRITLFCHRFALVKPLHDFRHGYVVDDDVGGVICCHSSYYFTLLMYERINICKTSFLFVLFAFTIAENRSYSSFVILVDTVTCCPFCAVHTLVHVGRLRPLAIRVNSFNSFNSCSKTREPTPVSPLTSYILHHTCANGRTSPHSANFSKPPMVWM